MIPDITDTVMRELPPFCLCDYDELVASVTCDKGSEGVVGEWLLSRTTSGNTRKRKII